MTKSKEDILERLKIMVMPLVGKEKPISIEDHLTNDLGIDSMDLVDIIVEIEDTFSIIFDDLELNDMETINDLVEKIEHKSHAYSQAGAAQNTPL